MKISPPMIIPKDVNNLQRRIKIYLRLTEEIQKLINSGAIRTMLPVGMGYSMNKIGNKFMSMFIIVKTIKGFWLND